MFFAGRRFYCGEKGCGCEGGKALALFGSDILGGTCVIWRFFSVSVVCWWASGRRIRWEEIYAYESI